MNKSIYIIEDLMGDEYFPDIDVLSCDLVEGIREITITSSKPVIYFAGDEMYFKDKYNGGLTKNCMDALKVTDSYIDSIISKLTDGSPYMFEKTISEGYIPYKNGIRVSVTGEGYTDTNDKSVFRKITTISIRISKTPDGISGKYIQYITDGTNVFNTLIVSPPGCGKTTLLRDITKNLANLFRVGIADERGEICIGNMGLCPMIIKGIPKRKAFDIFIRNASADVIVCDEIGGSDDASLLFESIRRGVNIIATIHGNSPEDLKENPLSRNVYPFFDTVIYLSPKKGAGEVKEFYFKGEKKCFI